VETLEHLVEQSRAERPEGKGAGLTLKVRALFRYIEEKKWYVS